MNKREMIIEAVNARCAAAVNAYIRMDDTSASEVSSKIIRLAASDDDGTFYYFNATRDAFKALGATNEELAEIKSAVFRGLLPNGFAFPSILRIRAEAEEADLLSATAEIRCAKPSRQASI